MRKIDRIVIHTNGSPGRTVNQIRLYHRLKGWKDIGYHYVVYEDGSVHPGRPEHLPGAGVKGLNAHTLHVCFVGNGDARPLTPAQLNHGLKFVAALRARYGLKYQHVIGHRETRYLVPAAIATKKTCPGVKVDMLQVRELVEAYHG